MFPVLKVLHSPDYEPPNLPPDPRDCVVLVEVDIGPHDEPGADIFHLVVVTPAALARMELPLWGRGYLIVKRFSWQIVEEHIKKLLLGIYGHSWNEISTKLNKTLLWEFDDYKP
jgi:hypothetical protein